jgi:hypothetical protein
MKSQFQNKQTHHEIKTATDKFLQRVSDGITYLIERHGYSRERASNLILGEIRKNQRLPSDDEIFTVMEKLNLGVDEATEAIVISNALRTLQSEQKLSTPKAIDYLTSCLTTIKLLSKVETNRVGDGDFIMVEMQSGTTTNLDTLSISSSTSSLSISSSPTSPTTMNKPLIQSSSLSFSTQVESRKNKNNKNNKDITSYSNGNDQEQKEDEINNEDGQSHDNDNDDNIVADADDVDDDDNDVNVTQKVILQQHSSTLSPTKKKGNDNKSNRNSLSSTTSTTSSTTSQPSSPKVVASSSRGKRELDSSVQNSCNNHHLPTQSKRQRLDSI